MSINLLKSAATEFKEIFSFIKNLKQMAKGAALMYIAGALILSIAGIIYNPQLQVAFVLFGAFGGSAADITNLYTKIFASKKEDLPKEDPKDEV
jgi:hypothetical protein